MSKVAEIETAIQELSAEELRELREWWFQQPASEDNDDVLTPRAYRQKVLDALDQP